MCGLVGWMAADGNAQRRSAELSKAVAALVHRGPDDEGTLFDRDIALGFRRLSILDLTAAGHQPMNSANGEWAVCFNGEIYNFLELKQDLEREGVKFHSSGDTEVLVEGLAHWGWSILDRCNGMWAILAWHRPSRTLYAVRDPWSIKPLYMHRSSAGLAFASEIGALLAFGCDRGELDRDLLCHFIATGELDCSTRTHWSRIQRIAPGRVFAFRAARDYCNWAYDDGTDRTELPPTDGTARSDERYVEAFAAKLTEAVHMRLRADVPVGTCMSGGLDSTSIACLAAERLRLERTAPCRHAFTAQLAEFDEREYIGPVLERTGATWHVTTCADDQLQASISAFLTAQGEPIHSLSAFAGYMVMALAAQAGVKVLLNGQGADELLAGYPSTVSPFLRSIARGAGPVAALNASRSEYTRPTSAFAAVARAYGGLALAKLPLSTSKRLYNRFSEGDGRGALLRGPDLSLGSSGRSIADLHGNLRDQQDRSPLPLYLRIEDVNSSAFSLESRLPFLDPSVIALARNAPPTLLRRDGRNKFLLREAVRGIVPDIVRGRADKMGFPVPSARWLRGPLAPLVREAMISQRLAERGIYRDRVVLQAVDHMLAGGPLPRWLARTIVFELWAACHIDAPRA